MLNSHCHIWEKKRTKTLYFLRNVQYQGIHHYRECITRVLTAALAQCISHNNMEIFKKQRKDKKSVLFCFFLSFVVTDGWF